MGGPLTGIRILGFTHFAQAPFAMQLLGDLGADVINIERPGTGDFNRTFFPDEKTGNESPFFMSLNRNKRSIVLDLKNTASREVIEKLIKRSDVVVCNYRPGVLNKLGLGYEDCKKINESIIYCEASGFGSTGPYANQPGQDLIIQSISGYTSICGTDGMPMTGGVYVIDMYSSVILACGILSAIIHRMNTGHGQKVEVNLLNSAFHLQSQEYTYFLNTGNLPKRPEKYTGHVYQEAPYGIYKTLDGYISISANMYEKEIKRFGEILEIDNLNEIMPNKKVMIENRDEIYEVISEVIKKKPSDYWLQKFKAEGFWCAKTNTYDEAINDPQVIHNDVIKEINHPKAGTIRVIGTPIKFSETPPEIRMHPPLLGEHSESILSELGYSNEEIEELKSQGIFGDV